MDDPFVYCTEGCKETKAWKPAPPYAGVGYIPQLGYCPFPTTSCCDSYCILQPWSTDDFNDYFQNRVRICPRAHTDGSWVPRDGQGSAADTPYSH
ncbi:hypothetical protein [Luteimonas aquatica]|uniref:hypothetical protein n=1 Tax=Luteimonas aquatica TaxID=450364 RepID=UPI001F58D257|nr:hypothetical protein [Luteimonas aquatica]